MSEQALAAADIGPDDVLRRRGDVAVVDLDGQAVLYDPDAAAAHHLDAIGALVWDLLDGAAPLSGQAAALADAFGADPAVVESDIVRLTRDLGALGLLEGVMPAAAVHRHRHHAAPAAADGDEPEYLTVPPNT